MTENAEHKHIDLGFDHKLSWIIRGANDDTRIGAIIDHPSLKDGSMCSGGIQWAGSEWQDANPDKDVSKGRWELHSLEPLHVEPSILCMTCGDHGFIREGKWVVA